MENSNSLSQKIFELGTLQPWNHNFILPHGVQTRPGNQTSHGKNNVKLERLKPIFDLLELSGKRVLDMGCNEGFFSLEMASQGAEVTGIDIDEKRILKANFIKSILAENQKINFEILDIYSDEFSKRPQFDITLCLGFIHRVPDPFRALSQLADRSKILILEWKALKHGPHHQTFAYLSTKGVNEDDYYGTEYWLLSYKSVEQILKFNGYKHFHRIDDPRQRRAILIAGKSNHDIFELPDQIVHRGRTRTFLSHTKRYLATCNQILNGNINI